MPLRHRLAALLLALAAAPAAAQEAAPAPEPVFEPPELIEYVTAEYPPEAFAAGLEAVVVATIDIDESGLVTSVTVVEPAGMGFDEAASAAMLAFVFSPATRDGEPVPSQVLYRYRFFIEEVAAEPEDADAGPDAGVEDGSEPAVDEDAAAETVVRGRHPPREVTRREVTRREITRIPGTGGDALRAIQNLPGMARAPAISGALIVRGSSPGDTEVFLDSLPMPLLYHFGGLTSVVNSDLLESIDFFPGNYSVRYGGATGGIIDATTRAPQSDRVHAYVDADVWDVGALVEAPVGGDWSVAAAARRSYIDGILNAVLPEDGGLGFTTAPRYWDYQVLADWHPPDGDSLRLTVYGSDDRLVLVMGDDVLGNPTLGGGADVRLSFHLLQAAWEARLSSAFANRLSVGGGLISNAGDLGEQILFEQDEVPLRLRDELTIDPGRFAVLRLGVDAEAGWARWRFRAPEVYPREGAEWDPLNANTGYVEDEGEVWFTRPGWYGELELTAVDRLRMIYGLRFDYYDRISKVEIDPRMVARYRLWEGATSKAGLGLFHQSPDGAMANEEYGNPDLKNIKAVHYGLGLEQVLPEPLSAIEIGLEGFYKDISDLPVPSDRTVERGGEPVPEIYASEGTGEVWGLELLVKHQPTERLFGWISYTLMRSSRVDCPGCDPRPFDHDQTHILTVVASAVVGRGWEAGARFRLVSGEPVTPVIAAAYDADSDIHWPVYGAPNSERLPLFHQLDLRVDKRLRIEDTIDVSVYVDVQNVYNRKNVEGYRYAYDYSRRVYFYGLPVLPSLGLKIEY